MRKRGGSRMFRWILAVFALPLAAALPLAEDVRVGQLENGVTYYVWPMESESVSLRLAVPVGSVHEVEGEEGIAHLVEHCVFRGTGQHSKSAIDGFLEKVGANMGADCNAYTSFDQTVYMIDLPEHDLGDLQMGLEILAGFAGDALMRDSDIEEERLIVLEEWRRSLGHHHETYIDLFFGESKYAKRLPIGLESTLRSVRPEVVRGFWEKWYPTVPVAIVVVGDVDADVAEKLVEATFGDRKMAVAPPEYGIDFSPGVRSQVDYIDQSGYELELFFRRPGRFSQSDEEVRAELADDLMVQMLKARLIDVCNAYGCMDVELFSFIKTLEILAIDMRVATPGLVKDDLSTIAAELKRIERDGFTQEELELARGKLKKLWRAAASHHESPSHCAMSCVEDFLGEEPLFSIDLALPVILETLDQIGLHEVMGPSLESDCVVHVMAPADSSLTKSDLDHSIERGQSKQLGSYTPPQVGNSLMSFRPLAGSIVERVDDGAVRTLTLGNGLKVQLMATDQEGVLVSGVATGGITNLDEEDWVAAQVANLLIRRSGVGTLSREEVDRILNDQLAEMAYMVNPYTRNIIGGAFSEDVESLLQMIHLTFTEQQYDWHTFMALKSQMIRSGTDPIDDFIDRVDEVNYGDHPLFRRPSAEELRAVTYEQVVEIAQEAFGDAGEFVFTIVGDFDLEEMESYVAQYLGSLVVTKEPGEYTPIEFTFPEGITWEAVYSGDQPQSSVQISFPLTAPVSAEGLMLVGAAADIIEERLKETLRQRLSGTYFVQTGIEALYPDFGTGIFYICFMCDPQDAELMVQVALRELRILFQRGPTVDEVVHQIRNARRSLQEGQRENGFWLEELELSHLLDGWSLSNIEGRLNALSQAALADQIQLMCPLTNYTVVILYPEEMNDEI